VPLWHDSEVAAIAYAIQQIIAQGNSQLGPMHAGITGDDVHISVPPAMMGKKCSECGAHAMIRKDGCDYCTQCGYMGSCG
jgi:ribonucleoside-diphosphate reductase alpha chain